MNNCEHFLSSFKNIDDIEINESSLHSESSSTSSPYHSFSRYLAGNTSGKQNKRQSDEDKCLSYLLAIRFGIQDPDYLPVSRGLNQNTLLNIDDHLHYYTNLFHQYISLLDPSHHKTLYSPVLQNVFHTLREILSLILQSIPVSNSNYVNYSLYINHIVYLQHDLDEFIKTLLQTSSLPDSLHQTISILNYLYTILSSLPTSPSLHTNYFIPSYYQIILQTFLSAIFIYLKLFNTSLTHLHNHDYPLFSLLLVKNKSQRYDFIPQFLYPQIDYFIINYFFIY
ncbi:hypothetical protein WA158_007928 [Blastocystis sp. Blastoise]